MMFSILVLNDYNYNLIPPIYIVSGE